MISTHIHHVSKVEASEAVKLASGSYSRVYTMHTERGESTRSSFTQRPHQHCSPYRSAENDTPGVA
jgi:hypothetical protein